MPSPLPGFEISTPYGKRGLWLAGYHTGDDYATHGVQGVPVHATRNGTVLWVGNAWGKAYGLHVVVAGPHHRVRAGYCHLRNAVVQAGDEVRAGQVIAYSGNTGRSTGPHLHYEERHAPFGYWDHRPPRWNKH